MRRCLGFWSTLSGASDFRLGSFRKGNSPRTALAGLKGWSGDSEVFTVSPGYTQVLYPRVIRTTSTELTSKLNSGISDVQDVQRDVEVPD